MRRVKQNSTSRVLAVVLVLAGCYWSRYPELMETHLVLLDQFSAKLEDVARQDGGVPMENWKEFVYPLERAQEFARIAGQRFPDRGSLRAFQGTLVAYGALVDDPALLLREDAADRIGRGRAELLETISATRIELERESASP